jgi:phage/plasmid-associated DNA primase
MAPACEPRFTWTLEKSIFCDSIFNKKKMKEYANKAKLYGFMKSDEVEGEMKEIIQNFVKLENKKAGHFETGYNQAKYKWGRIIPTKYLSLSVFWKQFRHTVCEGIYTDIDMVNAHPVILSEVCRMNDIDMPHLNKYNENCKKIREEIANFHKCDKDKAKDLTISLMYGGSYDSWLKEVEVKEKMPLFASLENELKSIMEIIYHKNPQIKKDVLKSNPDKWTNEREAKRGVMSLWCQTIERHIQEGVIKYIVEKCRLELEKIVPCQDGFMIKKEYEYPEIIDDINQFVAHKYGMNIKFAIKPFDMIMEVEEGVSGLSLNDWVDLISVKKLADAFIEKYGEFILKYKQSVFVYHNNRWYNETDNKQQHRLIRYISEDLYDLIQGKINDDNTLEDKDRVYLLKMLRIHTSSGNKMNDVIKHILSIAKETETDFNSNPFLLGFNNGVFDLQADEFRPYQYDDYITMTTKYDYATPDYDDPEQAAARDELIEIFETIQPDNEQRDLYLQILASGLDGRAYQKLFLFNGQGGNGKGLTGSLMDTVLGDYYHQPGNGILKDVEKANTPSPDMINLKGKRYINFKEVQGEVKVAMLRNLTGGGKFAGRYLNQNPEHFTMSGTFCMEFNVAPDLDGKPQQADYRRLVDIPFPVNFTDNPLKIDQVVGGVQYRKANPYYETQGFLQKSRLIFLDMLIGVYARCKNGENGMEFTIPESIRLRTEAFMENQNLFHKVFNELWMRVDIIPDNKADEKAKTVQAKEVWDSIQASDEYRNLTYKEKRQYGRDECYKWLEGSFTITGDKKTGKLIVGIGLREKYENELAKELNEEIDMI